MQTSPQPFINLLRRAASSVLRLVPGSAALRIKRDLRDRAWTSEADAIVISFPKSGRTYVRAMLARLYQLRFGIDERFLLEFPLLRRASPDVPRVLFTHAGDSMRPPEKLVFDADAYLGRRPILITRHPGDIAVSRYYHLKHRSRDRARRQLASQPLEDFVWASEGGIPSIVEFINQFGALPGIVAIRYEDFLDNPSGSLERLAEAIGLGTNRSEIAEAVQFASIDNLKSLERDGYFTSKRLRHSRKDDERSGKVRSGGSGGYRDELSPEVVRNIDDYLANHLDRRFGYARSGRL